MTKALNFSASSGHFVGCPSGVRFLLAAWEMSERDVPIECFPAL
jgi:hypothetical protein